MGKSTITGICSIAMLVYQMVFHLLPSGSVKQFAIENGPLIVRE